MRLKTVLNRVHKVKGFVYEKARFHEDQIEITLRPRQRSRPICGGCGRRGPGYDTLPARRFGFVPLWGLAVFLLYARRRVNCPRCGVTAELLPWADGKHHLTHAYAVFLARWARRLSWREVAGIYPPPLRIAMNGLMSSKSTSPSPSQSPLRMSQFG